MYRIIQGEALEVAKQQPDNSVHCIVTSPPYFNLRMYDTAIWQGGDAECQHLVGNQVPDSKFLNAITNGVRPGATNRICKKCGALNIDQQIGLENSVAEYVEKLVILFHELRRVLHPSGVVFLNLGDSYAGSGGAGGDYNTNGKRAGQLKFEGTRNRDSCFKPKDLMLVPERVAIALQEDGWWVRSDIIWHKPGTMPESVIDRPTRAHEHVFMLTKARHYFFDYIAIQEPCSGSEGHARNARDVWSIPTSSSGVKHYATMPLELAKKCILAGSSEYGVCKECRAPYRRIIKKIDDLPKNKTKRFDQSSDWKPTCKCQTTTVVPAVVYDPFAGAGTTMLAAELLKRTSLGSELSANYIALAEDRITRDLIKYNIQPDRELITTTDLPNIFTLLEQKAD